MRGVFLKSLWVQLPALYAVPVAALLMSVNYVNFYIADSPQGFMNIYP